ncbi:MAG: polyphosphate polymerase domain-containing protein [Clostridiales bacterium]|nr:polyphosphate polymerase domain-containing protein [Clostridiales bacterium]
MEYQNIFKRYEIKYLITKSQQMMIKEKMREYTTPDRYGKSTICNVYFDTPDYRLIRRSLEKPVYKEKLRIRSYGVATLDSNVFMELKKKYKGVVYKRRMNLSEREIIEYICEGKKISDCQVAREIDYFMNQYPELHPKVHLSYDREAFYQSDDPNFRITFDENILWRDYDLSLCKGIYGNPILKKGQVLMELKTGSSIPLWMTQILTEGRIYRTSFSKYGNAYCELMTNNHLGGVYCA